MDIERSVVMPSETFSSRAPLADDVLQTVQSNFTLTSSGITYVKKPTMAISVIIDVGMIKLTM
jgi:hypothetical protein